MRMFLLPAPLLVVLCACAQPYEGPLPAYPEVERHAIDVNVTLNQPSAAPLSPRREAPAAHVLILQTTHLDRPAEVVGIVDVHEEMGRHEAALDALRMKAAAMGADAVVGVEFHHSDSHGEPTHLSGLAVRFVPALP